MRQFDEDTGWDATRRDVRHTKAALQARGTHAPLLALTNTLLTDWKSTDDAWTEAEDAVIDANAAVALADFELDEAVRAFASVAHHAFREGRQDEYDAYFPVPPSDIISLGLDSQITRVQRFFTVAKERTPPEPVAAALTRIESACAVGKTALAGRVTAAEQEARVLLRVRIWKESANAARRGLLNQLEAHAIAQKLPTNYADAFFLRGRPEGASKRKKDQRPDDGPAPTPSPKG